MTEEIIKYDKSFTEAEFLSKIDHIYMMILNSVMGKNLDTVKHYLSDNVYNELNKLVSDYKSKKITRIFNETNVKTSSIIDYEVTENEINIKVHLISRYMDFFVDDDGNFISGVNDHRIEKEHILIFTKKLNVKTLNEARPCPNCGHSLNINESGICPYCNQIIDMSNYDYVLTQIDSI